MESQTTPNLSGFSQKILRYFQAFLQTDFKKQRAPKRKIQLKSDIGFRMGVPLRKYVSLNKSAWRFAADAPDAGLHLKISIGQHTAPVSATLLDLIRQHVAAIESDSVLKIIKATIDYATSNRSKSISHPEKFVASVQLQFVEELSTRLIHPLLAILDGSFKEVAYSAVESIYDVETDLTDSVSAAVIENLPTAINTLIVSGNTAPMTEVLGEFFQIEDIRQKVQVFFDAFATADAFQELRDLQQSLRSTENQSLYLYFCDIKLGSSTFPLFYIPAILNYREGCREFVLECDPHLLINKQAVDWILQERESESAKLPVSPITDRILYLDGKKSFLDEMEKVLNTLIPHFDLAAGIDIRNSTIQQASSPTLKISNSAYIAIFDKSDEGLINDYEELMVALGDEQKGASRLFDNIIQGFLFNNPESVTPFVDSQWDESDIPTRLVCDSPIPVNEEQQKILTALKHPNCHYISVQGPPGTGKSHTITALAFGGIMNSQSILILSDKTEALDVVQDKLEAVLSKVRHGDEEFPNPILRLGRTGSTFNRIVAPSAREKIKTHLHAARQHSDLLESDVKATMASMRSDIAQTINALSEISFEDLNVLHQLESEISAIRPKLIQRLQTPVSSINLDHLGELAQSLDSTSAPTVLSRISSECPGANFESILSRLIAWKCSMAIAEKIRPPEALSLFTSLELEHHSILMRFIGEYESLRMPIFGWLFRQKKVHDLNMLVGATLPCPNPIDLHRHLDGLKQVAGIIGVVTSELKSIHVETLTGFSYRLLRDGQFNLAEVNDLCNLAQLFVDSVGGYPEQLDESLETSAFPSLYDAFNLIIKASRYASLWNKISKCMASVPKMDYVNSKTRLEQLNTMKMTSEIDRRFIDFVDNKKATVKEMAGVIRNKQKFPESEFHHLSDAFPVIIAGIREYADYVPLKQCLFDLVVIDEASQVSVAQALPAILRAKKVVVFGDAKQFSNIKSSMASATINASHLTDIEAYFRANVSDATTKLQRLKHFDVKCSILDFFDLIANFQPMLRKHFRGYQELISFSSRYFYEGQLQAIKIRSKPVSEILRFEILPKSTEICPKNTNRAEANFILAELHRMIDSGSTTSVGILSPFREQVKLLNDILFRDVYANRFESELKLKIMTFDTCQGEERDLIIFSMVATAERDVLNYIFPTDLEGIEDKAEESLRMQRLNVGFSRGKEAFLFVLSKPVDLFKGSIGRVLSHYKAILEDRSCPDASSVDPSSPMESKVLDWILKTPFFQLNEEFTEVIPQFPIGMYLKQLDPFYSHPAFRCDFLVRFNSASGPANVIVEYDGFAEHFVSREKINNGNWDRYYRPEDLERQMVIESYGFKFLRLNRFNLGIDPVKTISTRLYELVDVAIKKGEDSSLVAKIKADAELIENGDKKPCPKCGKVRELRSFWDPKLKGGYGGFGRNCMICKK